MPNFIEYEKLPLTAKRVLDSVSDRFGLFNEKLTGVGVLANEKDNYRDEEGDLFFDTVDGQVPMKRYEYEIMEGNGCYNYNGAYVNGMPSYMMSFYPNKGVLNFMFLDSNSEYSGIMLTAGWAGGYDEHDKYPLAVRVVSKGQPIYDWNKNTDSVQVLKDKMGIDDCTLGGLIEYFFEKTMVEREVEQYYIGLRDIVDEEKGILTKEGYIIPPENPNVENLNVHISYEIAVLKMDRVADIINKCQKNRP